MANATFDQIRSLVTFLSLFGSSFLEKSERTTHRIRSCIRVLLEAGFFLEWALGPGLPLLGVLRFVDILNVP